MSKNYDEILGNKKITTDGTYDWYHTLIERGKLHVVTYSKSFSEKKHTVSVTIDDALHPGLETQDIVFTVHTKDLGVFSKTTSELVTKVNEVINERVKANKGYRDEVTPDFQRKYCEFLGLTKTVSEQIESIKTHSDKDFIVRMVDCDLYEKYIGTGMLHCIWALILRLNEVNQKCNDMIQSDEKDLDVKIGMCKITYTINEKAIALLSKLSDNDNFNTKYKIERMIDDLEVVLSNRK